MGDCIVLAVLGVSVLLAVGRLRRDRKNGGCCGNCSGCAGCCQSKK